MRTPPRTRSLLLGAVLAALLVTGGCAGSGSDDRAAGATQQEKAAPADAPAADSAADSVAGSVAGPVAGSVVGRTDAGQKTAGRTPAQAVQTAQASQQAIIATGTVSVEATDVGAARFEVQKIVDQAGGSITQEETTTDDDGDLATTRIVLRVPSARFADAKAALEKVGTLTSSTSQAEDVTTQVIDVAARVRAQQRSVRRIESLLARAASLREIISIESELAQRQADLDSLTSQQKYLADQTSLSTLTVHLQQPDRERHQKKKDRDGFLGGLANGWDAFLTGIGAVAVVLGYLLPWLVTLLVLGVPAWWLVRSRRGRRPAPARQP
ncbi:MAG TPA: DUF4349 domain-containing protein [Nocardioides sp.]|nr:DUF4349 domain-containing protein [Nocardioides sp.]